MVRGILRCQKLLCCRCNAHQKMSIVFYHMQETSEDERVSDWCERGFPKLLKLCHLFRNVDQIDGRLINVDDGTIITNESVHTEFKAFKSLARLFTKFRTPHQDDENDVEPVLLNSLTKVCDILGVSAQQRSKMRLSICPQITQHHIFRGALEEMLKNLRTDVDSLLPYSRAAMIVQIVAIVLKIFDDYSPSSDPSSSSWMRLASTKKSHGHSYKWGDILEMLNDLSQCLAHEKLLMHNNLKIQAMKEGLYQLKEVLTDRDIGDKGVTKSTLCRKNLQRTWAIHLNACSHSCCTICMELSVILSLIFVRQIKVGVAPIVCRWESFFHPTMISLCQMVSSSWIELLNCLGWSGKQQT